MKPTRILLALVVLAATAACDQATSITAPDPNGAATSFGLGAVGSGGRTDSTQSSDASGTTSDGTTQRGLGAVGSGG